MLAATFQFKLNKTSPNPINTQRVSNIIQSGAFKLSRNPIYLGAPFVLGFRFQDRFRVFRFSFILFVFELILNQTGRSVFEGKVRKGIRRVLPTRQEVDMRYLLLKMLRYEIYNQSLWQQIYKI
ncbi:isoprenylcysteine_carboxylmethyltransferase family protein [Hexamita inflata]|uniref:Isoprenylcysteine carboxylmethyltransferase family protein n=1 Tax=Hexamita inflata TaxID=28002 RepID=A0AA86P1G0_9EUKA|nr:isoprenylcysteine carboxylmethyltransferase family protein [Hexamita inflata]CAI9928487.1 isoprenylcysteine carboxylmethyltransferase family protein [Hexamita inflata]